MVWISKSGLGILIRAPEVPFFVPSKRQKRPITHLYPLAHWKDATTPHPKMQQPTYKLALKVITDLDTKKRTNIKASGRRPQQQESMRKLLHNQEVGNEHLDDQHLYYTQQNQGRGRPRTHVFK